MSLLLQMRARSFNHNNRLLLNHYEAVEIITIGYFSTIMNKPE
jgi:hypothetical protein